ncbi:MAG: hypothetical protein ABSE57_11135 [Bryobacteraceae bacterium]|jgi:hypothetical protein
MKAISTLALLVDAADFRRIIGPITDPSGAFSPAAKVTVRSVATGASPTLA